MATQDPTTNYNWDLPDVGGDPGAWGGGLNSIIGDDVTGIDAVLKTVSDAADAAQATADAALPAAGGTMTGAIKALAVATATTALGNIGTTQALNMALGECFTATVTDNVTISITNVPSGSFASGLVLKLTNGGAHTITWANPPQWAGGAEPSWTASGTDVIILFTPDAGTTWYGVALLDVS